MRRIDLRKEAQANRRAQRWAEQARGVTARGYITPLDPVPTSAEWRAPPGAPAYEVSEYGHLRRIATRGGRPQQPLVLRPKMSPSAYLTYNLSVGGKSQSISAHRLVALTFLGEPPTQRHHAAHTDGRHLNCHVGNLRWATAVENAADAKRHGTSSAGANHPLVKRPWLIPQGSARARSKLTEEQVMEIRKRVGDRVEIAKEYGVSPGTIGHVQRRYSWKHLP